MSRKIDCLKRIATTLGAECDSKDNTTCETLSKIADALPNALGSGGGGLKLVLKESLYLLAGKEGALTGDYANKVIVVQSYSWSNIVSIASSIESVNPVRLSLWQTSGDTYEWGRMWTDSLSKKINMRNTTTTTTTYKIYELEVA